MRVWPLRTASGIDLLQEDAKRAHVSGTVPGSVFTHR